MAFVRRPSRIASTFMRRPIATLVMCWLLLPGAARSDWLVFKDGKTTETKGPWKIKGRQVVFSSKLGVLQAVALAEVDVTASQELSKNATTDHGIQEVRTNPQPAYDHLRAVGQTTEEHDGVRITTTWLEGDYVGTHPAEKCLSAKVVSVRTGTDWLLQVGTKIERFRPVGLEWADADRVRALLGSGRTCIVTDLKVDLRDREGRLVGYALLPDDRDLGYELLKIKAARVNNESFDGRSTYLRLVASQ